jgi:uncharacterized RDD family membrane protein YckC
MTTMPLPPDDLTVGRQGHYAGSVSRLVAFAADIGASWGLYTLGVALLNQAIKLVTGHSYALSNHRILAVIVLTVWEFLYFFYQWALSGRTLGMAIFGIQVVTVEGGPITARQAVLRTLGLALCLLTLGIGFLGIIFQRQRRGLNDYVAGTVVVYSWDARAARLRWIARTEGAVRRSEPHMVQVQQEERQQEHDQKSPQEHERREEHDQKSPQEHAPS